MAISERTFEAIVLEDPEGHWELHHGRPREKPIMSVSHGDLAFFLGYLLQTQLDRHAYRPRINAGLLRRGGETEYIPDVCVVPVALMEQIPDRPGVLERYDAPLPLVVEIWSQSTGSYDVNAKIPEYQRRGDQEIWRLHPYERTLTAWRRQPNGSYDETTYDHGLVAVRSLPGVVIDLDRLFNRT